MNKYQPLDIGFKPKVNKTSRLVLKVDNQLKPIFWFKLSKDGSLYFGISSKHSDLKSQVVNNDKGILRFNLNDGQNCPGHINKISHHGSGVVHMPVGNMPNGRGFSKDLREIDKEVEICRSVLPHPRFSETIAEQRKTDIVLDYSIDHSCPINFHFHVGPVGKLEQMTIPQIKYGRDAAVRYSDLKGISDRILRFTLWHGPEMPWADEGILVLPLHSIE